MSSEKRHCLRGVDGKYIQWNEILRDMLNGKLKITRNRTRKSHSEKESDEKEIGCQDESDSGLDNRYVRKKTNTNQ